MSFQAVVTGFALLEAPRWDERGLWFSDIALGGVRCLRADGRIDSWLPERRIIGGIAMNEDGALICSGPGGLVWLDPGTGASSVLLDSIDGVPISGINDMVADGRGGLYFGTVDHAAMQRGEPFYGRSEICHLDPGGGVRKLRASLHFANGMGIAPDGATLYVNDSGVGTFAFALSPGGTLGDAEMIGQDADCDGLAIDCEGGIWIANIGSSQITRLMPDGRVDRRMDLPGEHVTSLCFGGGDLRDLYVTTAAPDAGQAVMGGALTSPRNASIYKGRSDVAGLPLARTAFTLI